jgi:hypothetical protein
MGTREDLQMNDKWRSRRLQRKLVSETQLARILTRRIRRTSKAKGVVRRVFRLTHPDEYGCNWIPEIAFESSASVLYPIVANARFEFNLKQK